MLALFPSPKTGILVSSLDTLEKELLGMDGFEVENEVSVKLTLVFSISDRLYLATFFLNSSIM